MCVICLLKKNTVMVDSWKKGIEQDNEIFTSSKANIIFFRLTIGQSFWFSKMKKKPLTFKLIIR